MNLFSDNDKQPAQKSNKTPVAVTVNKSNVKNVTKSVNQTVQQTNAMKKAIENRGENNNCNDEFSQWCCKHLATLNKNTIDSELIIIFSSIIREHQLNLIGPYYF